MLSEFDFKVVHTPGVDNKMDCLSRFFQEEMRDSTGVRQEGDLEESSVLAWPAASCLAWTCTGDPHQTGLRGRGTTAAVAAVVRLLLLRPARASGLEASVSRGLWWRQEQALGLQKCTRGLGASVGRGRKCNGLLYHLYA
jgi:hypothetical protein